MWLADLTWPEVRLLAEADAVLAVPLGATEQHGPHLPLSTDTDIAMALCARLAAARLDVLVAPPVPFGSSGEHAGFAGTLSIGQAATELLVTELGRSATDTFRHVLFVSAHGGNAEPVGRAVSLLRKESRDIRLFQPRWTGDPHAGRPETAMMLSHRATTVHMDRAATGNIQSITALLPRLRTDGVRAVSPSGVLGDPVGATAAEGSALLDELAAALIKDVGEWLG